ncbi:MAG TPA: ATP-binding protein, partial [Labilithrix sp.]|nr:ATP-binding protein [Labilithrix sp.]
NLLQNAAKFTPEGGKTSVALCTDGAATKAIVRVRDTGEGMAPAILAHLFEPFTQAETTLDRSRGGLGVGLSLVKELVELHGGTVFVRSDGPGKGTEITVRLPLSESVSMRAEPKANLGHEPTRVLIIEDNVDGAETLCEALKLGGHVVEIAYTGREGLEKARCFRPDIVFCDIGLPQMDGYAVARAIRQTPELSDLKLVALTGYISAEDIAKSRAAGFDRHLAKPPTIDLLEKTVKELARAPAKKVGDPARAPGGRF